MNRPLTLVALAALLVSCDSESPIPNVAGTYTINLTVTKLDCAILPSPIGTENTGVSVVFTQDPADKKKVTATVQGAIGLALNVFVGSDSFTGTLTGNSLDLALEGKSKLSADACAYSQNARLKATVNKEFLSGTITYSYATNKASDCGIKDTCTDEQTVTGSRPATAH
jgi:hypothetical protein